MAKKRDYTDFKKFVKANKNLTRTEVYWKYREQGGKIKKQTALDLAREVFQVEKREDVRKTLTQVRKSRKGTSFINFDLKKDAIYLSNKSPAIQHLKTNIKKLYGKVESSYLQIGITVDVDDYTNNSTFSILVSFNERKKQPVKKLGNDIIDTIKRYYLNLAKMYGDKNNTVNLVLEKLDNLQAYWNKQSYLKQSDLRNIFKMYGFDIGEIKILRWGK